MALRYIGIKEVKGSIDNPVIMAMLKLDADWPEHDEVPWCSAFGNWICWNLGLSRSGDLMARSWMYVGNHVDLHMAQPGMDIAVLSRGNNPKWGHFGFFYEYRGQEIGLVGGNQGDSVGLDYFDIDRLVAVRRLVKG